MKNQIKVAVFLSYAQTLITITFSFFTLPIIIKKIGVEEYGVYTLANSLLPYLGILDLGMSNSIVRYVTETKLKKEKEKEKELNSIFFISYGTISLVILLIVIPIILNLNIFLKKGLTILEIEKLKYMMLIIAIYVSISFPLKIFQGILTAYEKFYYLKLISFIVSLLSPIVLLIIINSNLNQKIIYLVLLNCIVGITSSLFQMGYCIRILKVKFKFKNLDFKILKEILRYSFYIFLGSIVDILYWNTDNYVLGALVSSQEVAIYSIASKFNEYFSTFTMIISGFMLPQVMKLIIENKSNKEITALFIKVSNIQIKIVGFIILNFLFVGKEFINIWVGSGFDKSYLIALSIMVVRIIPICQVLGTSILQAKNKHKFRSIVYIFIALFNLVISIPLGKKFGGIGCAIGTVIGITMNIIIINLYYLKIGLDMKKYWKNLLNNLKYIFILLIIGLFLVKILNPITIFDILLFIFLFSLIYLGIIVKFLLTQEELNKLKIKLNILLNAKLKNRNI